MRKNRVNKICETCGNEFEVIKAREKTAKFCCRKCVDKWNTGKPTWNSGKTYEECYDEETIKLIKSKQSHIGTDNGMYGKTHTSATKKIMSETHAGKTP
jgi:hypothetical protein